MSSLLAFRLWWGSFEATERNIEAAPSLDEREIWELPSIVVELLRSSCEAQEQHLSLVRIQSCPSLRLWWSSHPFDCGGAPSKQSRSKESRLELLRSSREAKLRHLSRKEFWQVHFRLWWRSFEAAEKQRSSTQGEQGFWTSLLRSSRATQKQHLGRVCVLLISPFDRGGARSKQLRRKAAAS